jgi:hypothetical protein
MSEQSEVDDTFGHYLVFNNEATFDLSGKVNKNVYIRGTGQFHITMQVTHASLNVNVFCQRQRCMAPSTLQKMT